MNLEITVNFGAETLGVLGKLLSRVETPALEVLEKPVEAVEPEPVEEEKAEPKKARGRPKKEAVEVEEKEEDAIEDFEAAGEDEDDSLVDADTQSLLRSAVRAYAAKHSKDAAVAILTKFGKTTGHVMKKDAPKLLKALKL